MTNPWSYKEASKYLDWVALIWLLHWSFCLYVWERLILTLLLRLANNCRGWMRCVISHERNTVRGLCACGSEIYSVVIYALYMLLTSWGFSIYVFTSFVCDWDLDWHVCLVFRYLTNHGSGMFLITFNTFFFLSQAVLLLTQQFF